MHFKLKTTPSGQVLQLVESYRNGQGQPCHRIVVSLGNARIEKCDQTAVATAVADHLYGRASIFGDDSKTNEAVRSWKDRIVRLVQRQGRWHPLLPNTASVEGVTKVEIIDGVVAADVSHEHTTEVGPELTGIHAWNALRMPAMLEGLGFNHTQCVRAAVTVINRLVEPVSEHQLTAWMETTALPELLGPEVRSRGDDAWHRVSDKLRINSKELESRLRRRQEDIFNIDRTLLLYDLTNTHFEGRCESNPDAVHGKNKQGRDDCPQIVVGMVFDQEGFSLTHKVFAGNQHDGKSLLGMIESMREIVDEGAEKQQSTPIVIMDAGVGTKKNRALLADNKLEYLVNVRRGGRSAYANCFTNEEAFTVISGRDGKPPVRVCLIHEQHEDEESHTHWTETVVLCKSDARGEKEKAIRSNAEARFEKQLDALIKRVERGKLVDEEKIQRAIGTLQGRHPRVKRYYDVRLINNNGKARIVWSHDDEAAAESGTLAGCYVLRTNRGELTAEQIWRLYMTLLKAENGFRALKSDLGLRPNFHQVTRRVNGHVFICILAYQLLRFIEQKLESVGDNRTWATIRRVLRTHCYTTIKLPTKDGKIYRIRKAGDPEECQKAIYRALGIDWKSLPRTKIVSQHKLGTTL